MVQRYGLMQKTVPYGAFIGKRWAEIDEDPSLRGALVAGCEHDVELTREIARRQLAVFPGQELPIVDMTIRMFTEPKFVGDVPKLRAIAQEEFDRKEQVLEEIGVSAGDLQSADKFVALLEECGEEVPYKDGKLKPIPCVAKSDPYMQELANRSDRAGLLASARLDVRSTLDETRSSRLAASAERGLMPVALNYCGAATTRWSGADKVNWQNLPGQRQDPDMRLRKSIMAPPGYKLVVADFAQIEYRILCAIAGEKGQLEALRQKRDIYCEFGEHLYGRTITKADKDERQLSKKVVLGCGYGLGPDKFFRSCQAEGLDIDLGMAQRAVKVYRRTHQEVTMFWRRCDSSLNFLSVPDGYQEIGPVRIEGGAVHLPNGLACPFHLEWDQAQQSWLRTTRYGKVRYWGGGLTEFLCQALARVILSDLMLRARKELGLNPALLVHDEPVYVVPEEMAESVLQWLIAWMSETPAWFPGLPMAAEGRIVDRYGK
jgi:hypothetical protein